MLNVNERLFLIDCAEGTQLQMRRFHIHLQRIKQIFISHLHGDHFFGLIGLLNSLHLLGRKDELILYGPPILNEIINLQLRSSNTTLLYPLIFHPLTFDGYKMIYEDESVIVHSFPLLHSIPTCGFIFREKSAGRKIRKDVVAGIRIPVTEMQSLKQGNDFVNGDGRIYRNEELTIDPPSPRSYAYCSDTAYTETVIPWIGQCDLLYHEATFMHEKTRVAKEKMHSTTIEAATLAKKAGVKKLLIGHFSARYDDLQQLLDEAKTIFPETILAEDGITLKI